MNRKDRILKVYSILNVEDIFEKIAGQKEDLLKKLKAEYSDDFSRVPNLEAEIMSIVGDASFIGWFDKNYLSSSGPDHTLADSIITLQKYKDVKNAITAKLQNREFLSKIFESEKFKGFDNKKDEEKRSFISNLQNLSIDQMQHIISVYYGGKILVNVNVEIDESKEKVGEVNGWNVWLPYTKDSSAKIAGYDPITYAPKTEWCTARTTGSNLFYDYVGRKNEVIFLFYIIKDNPVAKPGDKSKDNDWMSIGYFGSSNSNSDLKPYLQGKDGYLTVNRSNKGLVENDFIETLGEETWAAVQRLMESKIKSLNKVNPAKEIVEGFSKDLDALKKEVSKKSTEERVEFLSTILKYNPPDDVFRYIAVTFAKDKPEELFQNNKFKDLMEKEKEKRNIEENSLIMVALKNLAEKSPSIYFSVQVEKVKRLFISKSQAMKDLIKKKAMEDLIKKNNDTAIVSLAEKNPSEFYQRYLAREYSITPELKDLITLDLISASLKVFSESNPYGFIKTFDEKYNTTPSINTNNSYLKRLLDKEEKILQDPNKTDEEKALAQEEKSRIESFKNFLLTGARKKMAETQSDQYIYFKVILTDPDPENIALGVKNVAKNHPIVFFNNNLFKSEFSTPEDDMVAADGLIKQLPSLYFSLGIYKEFDVEKTSQAFNNVAKSSGFIYKAEDNFFNIRRKLKSEGYDFPAIDDIELIKIALNNISSKGNEHNVSVLIEPDLKKELEQSFGLDISNYQQSAVDNLSKKDWRGYFSLKETPDKFAYQNGENWKYTKEAAKSALKDSSPSKLISQFIDNTYRQSPNPDLGFGSILNFIITSPFRTADDNSFIAEILNAFLLEVSSLKKDFSRGLNSILNIIPDQIKSLINLKEAILSNGEGGILSEYFKDVSLYFKLPDQIIFSPDNLDLTILLVDKGIINNRDTYGLKVFLKNYLGNENPNYKYTKLRKLNLTQVDELAKQGIRKILQEPDGQAFFEIYKSDPLVDEVIIEVMGSRPQQPPSIETPKLPEAPKNSTDASNTSGDKTAFVTGKLIKLSKTLDSLGYDSYKIRSIISKII